MGPGAGAGAGAGSEYLRRTQCQFGQTRKFWRWWRGQLHDSVNVLGATELDA